MNSFSCHRRSFAVVTTVLALLCAIRIAGQSDDIAFVNVNVVPMDRERVLGAQTVLISAGRIKALGPTRDVVLPPGTQRVDGTGKYLMPGLADMHGHLTHRGPEQRYPLDTFPLLLVAHGVTTLRNMAGYSAILSLRQQIEAGTTLGPQIFTTGPVLEGRASLTANNSPTSAIAAAARAPDQVPQTKFIETADEATAEVRQQAREGYDAIKVYNLLRSLPMMLPFARRATPACRCTVMFPAVSDWPECLPAICDRLST